MSRRAPLVAVALLLALALGFVLLGAGVGGPAAGVAAAQEGNDTDEPEHVHPDDAGDGDDEETADWLEQRLGAMLSEGAIELSQGEYETARQYVGEDYRERLEQYVDVAGETEASEYAAAGQSQAELAELLAEYQETLEAYRAARDRGDEERARELARELADLSERIEALGVDLERSFERLDEREGQDFTDAIEAVNGTVTEVGTETDRIVEEEFVATSLSVTADGETVAADDPLRLEGRLTDEEGAPVANATIAVHDPAGATTVRTDDEGRFSVRHAPTLLPANASELPVEYRPEATAPYAPATASVPIEVQQIEGELAVDGVAGTAEGTPTVAFGDTVSVEVTATAAGEPRRGIPVRATLDGASGQVSTDASGRASPAPTVDVGVRAGDRDVRVAVPMDDRAVTFDPTTASVRVAETETALAVTAESADGGVVAVEGRLTTAGGEPVPGATVDVATEGSAGPVTTVQTGDDGRFVATIDAPEDAESVVVTASFDGAGSNLQGSTGADSVSLAAGGASGGTAGGSGGVGGSGDGGLADAVGVPGIGVALVLGLGIVAGGWYGYRRWWRTGASEEAVASGGVDSSVPAASGAGFEAALADARERLESDPSAATVLAYGAARSSIAAEVPAARGSTHREFLAACAADGVDQDTVAALETVTDRYETAAYDPSGIDREAAREALAAADRVA